MFTLTAEDVANRLGVQKQTVYAYVSRGKIRTQETGNKSRLYHRGDVERLEQSKRLRADPQTIGDALHWGEPLLETAISTIHNQNLYYRGYPITDLCDAPFEQTTAILWERDSVEFSPLPKSLRDKIPAQSSGFKHRATEAIAALDAFDESAFDPGTDAIVNLGNRAFRAVSDVVAHRTSTQPIGERVAKAWNCEPELIDTMLVICADHEINVSTFTTRCIASSGASLYAAILGGISAMKGGKHGGAYSRINLMLDEAGKPNALKKTIRSRIQRGARYPGFNHPLYPDGDVRSGILFDRFPGKWSDAVRELGESISLRATIDLAMCAVARDAELPDRSAATLFMLARVVGWVAHYAEQIESKTLIRPRARYNGPALS